MPSMIKEKTFPLRTKSLEVIDEYSDLQVASPAGPARHVHLWSASESLTAGPNVR